MFRQPLIYSGAISFVKPRRARQRSFVLAGLMLSTTTGCAIPGRPPATTESQCALLAVYDVEPVLIQAGAEHLAARLQADFGTLSKLGFDGVVVRQMNAEQMAEVRVLADHAGMTAIIEDSSATSDSSRPTEVAQPGSARVRMGSTGVIDSALADRLLWQYHQELIRGRTGGLLIDGLCGLPGEGPDLASIANGSDRETAASLSATLARARAWQTRLKGAVLVGDEHVKGALRVSAFRGNKCRFVLVVNPSLETRVHADVELAEASAQLGGAASAVEVPGTVQQPAGRVVRSQGGSIRTNVDLPPGEAALFELF